jgi:uncharacterized protein YbjT (DUF2867 family)
MNRKKNILVIGATGNQGRAVIDALLGEPTFSIRAFVRKGGAQSTAANTLRQNSVEVVEGDLDDTTSLAQAMRGVYGVFCVLNFQNGGVAKEEERGKRIADIAKRAGIQHFIYSSVGGAERSSGVPHFESKWHVEQHIRSIDLPYSIVRPTTFMTNLMESPALMRFLALSMSRGSISRKPLQMIAVEDIGKWVAHMFLNPQEYLGKAVEVAGDEVTFANMITAYRHVYGKTPRSIVLSGKLFSQGDLGKMFTWISKEGYKADLAMNRRVIPGLLTYEQFIAQKKAI